MIVDGEPVEAKLLDADEARAIYDEIVRNLRDPALLEYVGEGAIQASIFPIPPGEDRRIQIEYQQVAAGRRRALPLRLPAQHRALLGAAAGAGQRPGRGRIDGAGARRLLARRTTSPSTGRTTTTSSPATRRATSAPTPTSS